MSSKPKWKWRDHSERGELPWYDLAVGELRLCVHTYNGYPKDLWLGTCHKLGIEKVPLGKQGTPLEKAQERFVKYITDYIDNVHQLLHSHDTPIKTPKVKVKR
jgi:hypothetical protein